MLTRRYFPLGCIIVSILACIDTFGYAARFRGTDSIIKPHLGIDGHEQAVKTLDTHGHPWSTTTLKALGLDDKPTLLSKEAFSNIKERYADSGSDMAEAQQVFDMEDARVYARLSSVAYCSDSKIISSWSCTR